MKAVSELRRVADDLGRAAAAIEGAAAVRVGDAGTAVETRAHALNTTTGVVLVKPSPTKLVVSSTTRGSLAPVGPPVLSVDTATIAGQLAGSLADAGQRLILRGRA